MDATGAPGAIELRDDTHGVTPALLNGFSDGWPVAPTPERHAKILAASTHIGIAWAGPEIAGFITAISDGIFAAYIPLLEVRASSRARGSAPRSLGGCRSGWATAT